MKLAEFIKETQVLKTTITEMQKTIDELNETTKKQAELITDIQTKKTEDNADNKGGSGDNKDDQKDEIEVTEDEAKELEKLLNDI